MKVGQLVSDSPSDGGRRSPAPPFTPTPTPPYSCLVLTRPHPAHPAHAHVSPLSPPPDAGVVPGSPPSPCLSCSCGASAASSPGGCRVHEAVFTCPPPPPAVTCGVRERDSGLGLAGDGPLGHPGSLIAHDDAWLPSRATPEDSKEEGVKELLLRCVPTPSLPSPPPLPVSMPIPVSLSLPPPLCPCPSLCP